MERYAITEESIGAPIKSSMEVNQVGETSDGIPVLMDKIDRSASYMNVMTSLCPELIRVPPYYDSDRDAIEAAFQTLPGIDPQNARIVQIENTLMLEEMNISQALIAEAQKTNYLSMLGAAEPMNFSAEGNLLSDF